MDKVGLRHGPWRFEEVLDADKVIPRETVQRRRPIAAQVEKLAQHDRFLRGHAHALPEDRVEPADGIAERNHPPGKRSSRSKCRRTLAGMA